MLVRILPRLFSTSRRVCVSSQSRWFSQESSSSQESSKDSTETESAQKQALGNAALRHVPDLGWSITALQAGAEDLGWSPASASIFAQGPVDLVHFFMSQSNQKLVQDLQSLPLKDYKTQAILREGVRRRLELHIPYIERWSQAMALGACPTSLAKTLKLVAQTVDDIWYAAGDKSNDTEWYAKRAALGAIYASTELYMLTDKSPEFQQTWQFLDRRLDDAGALSTVPHQVQRYAGDIVGTLGKNVANFAAFGPSQFTKKEK